MSSLKKKQSTKITGMPGMLQQGLRKGKYVTSSIPIFSSQLHYAGPNTNGILLNALHKLEEQ